MIARSAVTAMLAGLSPVDEIIRLLQMQGEGLIDAAETRRRLPFSETRRMAYPCGEIVTARRVLPAPEDHPNAAEMNATRPLAVPYCRCGDHSSEHLRAVPAED